MKKTLSLISACALALCASAQQETVWSNAESLEALGLSGEASAVACGTVLAEGEVGTFSVAYEDNGKIMDISSNNIKSVIVNGEEYSLTKGTTGSTNPQGIGIATPPTGGWVYQLDIKKDGYVTIFSKLSSNKAYYVFESDMPENMAETALLLSYDLSMIFPIEGEEQVCSYTLPGNEDGYFTMDLPDADVYSDGTSMRWPEKIFLGADANDVKKNGFGCITFPVLADFSYFFCAQGSKANTNGFIFTEEYPNEIIGVVPEKTNADTGEVTPGMQWVFVKDGETTAISDIKADVKADNAMYNVLGVKVDSNYKGLVIKNGKKFYNR